MAERRKKKTGRPAVVTEELVAMAASMLAQRCHKSQVKAAVRNAVHDGKLSTHSCEKVITLARRRLVEATAIAAQDHRNQAYQFYTSVLQNPHARPLEKIKAQERIDKLLGLESPLVLQHTGAGGGPIQVVAALKNLSTEELEQLERLAGKAAGPGGDPEGAGGAEA